jgi:chlorophyll synthase
VLRAITTGTKVAWQTSRPAIWLTSVVPFYVGHLVATHQVWPSLHLFGETIAKATSGGLTGAEWSHAQHQQLHLDGDLLLSFLVVGPLFWLAALLLNDAYDVPGDRLNPRKADAPLVLGLVTPAWALRVSAVASVAAVAASLAVSGWLALITVALLAGNAVYSIPPLRWKTRPGADVLLNATGIGVLSPLGGWAIARPVNGAFPWEVAVLGFLAAVALYIPTTLVDHEADRQAGYTTFATAVGPRRAYVVGLVAWVLACGLALGLAATETLFPGRMLPMLVVGVPVLVLEYVLLIGRPVTGLPVFRGLVIVSFTFLVVNADFVALYGRLWV